eukprot:jgi/Psemu1/12326/gm1.12326_g
MEKAITPLAQQELHQQQRLKNEPHPFIPPEPPSSLNKVEDGAPTPIANITNDTQWSPFGDNTTCKYESSIYFVYDQAHVYLDGPRAHQIVNPASLLENDSHMSPQMTPGTFGVTPAPDPTLNEILMIGFDCPCWRGWIGQDHSYIKGTIFNLYAVKTGWDPGIYSSYAGAWACTVDFQIQTGIPFELKGFHSYVKAARYLGSSTHSDYIVTSYTTDTLSKKKLANPLITLLLDNKSTSTENNAPSSLDKTRDPSATAIQPFTSEVITVMTTLVSTKEDGTESYYRKLLSTESRDKPPSLEKSPSAAELADWQIHLQAHHLQNELWLVVDECLILNKANGPRMLETFIVQYDPLIEDNCGVSLYYYDVCNNYLNPNNESSAIGDYWKFHARVA